MKSCVELLRASGINILVVFSDIPGCVLFGLQTSYHFKASNSQHTTTGAVSDATSSLLTYSGEMFSIDPTTCFNVERVTSKSRIIALSKRHLVPEGFLLNW